MCDGGRGGLLLFWRAFRRIQGPFVLWPSRESQENREQFCIGRGPVVNYPIPV